MRPSRAGPVLLLLLASPLLSGALAVLGAVPRLICDSRVLERYILDAKEAENATVSTPTPSPRNPRGSESRIPPRSGSLDLLSSDLTVGSQSPPLPKED